jgi:hypothetical protein
VTFQREHEAPDGWWDGVLRPSSSINVIDQETRDLFYVAPQRYTNMRLSRLAFRRRRAYSALLDACTALGRCPKSNSESPFAGAVEWSFYVVRAFDTWPSLEVKRRKIKWS